MLPIKSAGERAYFLTLPDEILIYLFTRIKEPKAYTSLAQTCKHLHAISLSIPAIAFSSLPSRRHLLRHCLLSNPKLVDAAFKVIVPKNRHLICASNSMDKVKPTWPAEKKFYVIFKKLCIQLNVNMSDREFVNCVFDVRGLSRYFIGSVKKEAYKDMLNAFSSQPIERISIGIFCEKVRELHSLSRDTHLIKIETDLRRSLKNKHGRGFFELARRLQERNSKKWVTKIAKQLRVQLELKKTKIEKELKILEGSRDCSGSIEESRCLMEIALNAQKAAYLAYIKECDSKDNFSLNVANFESRPSETKVAFHQLVTTNESFYVARDDCLQLIARKNILAERNEQGDVIGGKLYQVEMNLKNIHEIALNGITLLARFYYELDRDVTDFNMLKRHDVLSRIISMQTLPLPILSL